MSKRELWEIVRIQDLMPGDYVKVSNLDIYPPFSVSSVKILGTGSFCYEIKPEFGYHVDKMYFSDEGCILRRIPDADDPRVLRRALDLAEKNSVVGDAFGRMCQGPSAEDYIDQARRELESEGNDGIERTDGIQV